MRLRRPWDMGEVLRLRRMRAIGVSYQDCASALDRSVGSIRATARRFGLARKYRHRWQFEDDIRRLHAGGLSDYAIAAELGLRRTRIQKWRVALGLAPNFRPGQSDPRHGPRRYRAACRSAGVRHLVEVRYQRRRAERVRQERKGNDRSREA
jgi:hypothetical protein